MIRQIQIQFPKLSKQQHIYLLCCSPIVNYELGSGNNVEIDVKVQNTGEDAFEAAFYLPVPPGVTYSSYKKLESSDNVPFYCFPLTNGGNTTVKCELGNPMATGTKVRNGTKICKHLIVLKRSVRWHWLDGTFR